MKSFQNITQNITTPLWFCIIAAITSGITLLLNYLLLNLILLASTSPGWTLDAILTWLLTGISCLPILAIAALTTQIMTFRKLSTIEHRLDLIDLNLCEATLDHLFQESES